MMGRVIVTILFIGMLIIISVIDIQKKQIYNEAVAALFVPAIVSFFVFPEISIVSRVLGAFSVSGIMLLISLISSGAFGGGDIKLMIPVGLTLGFKGAVGAGCIAVFAAAGYFGIVFLLHIFKRNATKTESRILPFAPFLGLGSIVMFLLQK